MCLVSLNCFLKNHQQPTKMDLKQQGFLVVFSLHGETLPVYCDLINVVC
jgi:hypothetical protein